MVASTSAGHATSECAWYFVAYSFDTTLGVSLAIGLHAAAVRWARARQAAAAAAADPPAKHSWAVTIAACGDYGVSQCSI